MKSKMSSFFAWKFRNFRLFWWGLLLSRISSEMQVVGISWHIYSLTNSPLSLGFIGLSRFLPVLFFALPGGIVADKFNRKKIIVSAQFVMIIISLILAITTLNHLINPLMVYFLIALSSFTSTFDTPARQSIVPQLVPMQYFLNAVSLNTILWQTALVIGPSIAGLVIAFWGIESVYFLNMLCFFVAILILSFIKIQKQNSSREISFNYKSVIEGLAFVFKTPLISSTMFLDFFATFFSSATVLLPIFAKDILKTGTQSLGLLYAAPAIGSITAGIIISFLGQLKNQGKILLASVTLYGLATAFFGITNFFPLALFFLFLTGVGDSISTIIRNTIRQRITPDYLRGRMVAVNMIFFMGGPQLGELEAGILANFFGAPLSVVIGGIGTIIVALLMVFFVPQLRNYQGQELITKI